MQMQERSGDCRQQRVGSGGGGSLLFRLPALRLAPRRPDTGAPQGVPQGAPGRRGAACLCSCMDAPPHAHRRPCRRHHGHRRGLRRVHRRPFPGAAAAAAEKHEGELREALLLSPGLLDSYCKRRLRLGGSRWAACMPCKRARPMNSAEWAAIGHVSG